MIVLEDISHHPTQHLAVYALAEVGVDPIATHLEPGCPFSFSFSQGLGLAPEKLVALLVEYPDADVPQLGIILPLVLGIHLRVQHGKDV